jgi:bacteriocin-like protein
METPINRAPEAIRPLSNDEMQSVSGGFLTVPPIHGGPISIPPQLPRPPIR